MRHTRDYLQRCQPYIGRVNPTERTSAASSTIRLVIVVVVVVAVSFVLEEGRVYICVLSLPKKACKNSLSWILNNLNDDSNTENVSYLFFPVYSNKCLNIFSNLFNDLEEENLNNLAVVVFSLCIF